MKAKRAKHDGDKLTPIRRLKMIAEILEQRDRELLASDGPVPQDPPEFRRIYLLAIGPRLRAGRQREGASKYES